MDIDKNFDHKRLCYALMLKAYLNKETIPFDMGICESTEITPELAEKYKEKAIKFLEEHIEVFRREIEEMESDLVKWKAERVE